MEPPLDYYRMVKAQPCLCCGRTSSIEAAHLQPPSHVFPGRFTRRSHHGLAGFFCIPLCSACHKSQTYGGKEHDWLETNIPGGAKYAYAWVAHNILEYNYDSKSSNDGHQSVLDGPS